MQQSASTHKLRQVWTPEEDVLFRQLISAHGFKYSHYIHTYFPNRTREQVAAHISKYSKRLEKIYLHHRAQQINI